MLRKIVADFLQVRARGLEPLRIAPPDPKSGASANSAMRAYGRGDRTRTYDIQFPKLAL